MQKIADGANFWAILGHFWGILAILGHLKRASWIILSVLGYWGVTIRVFEEVCWARLEKVNKDFSWH